ncbi:uncharacterized protein LOC134253091 [Saccostrea cucullata]|uniref:uncharacterized protein LOC134253091 n=1 Tax=Saccostrea cuccullata TaxID=36930 RepID=UPI002ED4C6D3
MECCSSHLCNNQGCGQPGYPLSRGPACFDCPQVSDPMLCDKLKVCELNQACYLQRELEFGDVYYTSRCIDNHACVSSVSSVDIIGKRIIEKCSKCCQEDLCNSQYLSGTLISSTKPLAVFSGNRCQRWVGLSNDCSHMVTQLPPISKLDSLYVVPPFYNNRKTLIQVISLNQTFVNCSIGQNVSRWHLNAQQYKNLEVTNEITALISKLPVLVTGFGMGNGGFNSYLTVIPGVNQFVDYYKITVPAGYMENFISVIIPEESANNIRINGSTSYQYKIVYQNNAVVGKTFNVRTFEVKSGAWVLNTTDRSKFGLIVFGHRTQDGYGFAGNFVLP